MTKTPYEIRKDLLDMARDILVYNAEQKNTADREDFMLQRDTYERMLDKQIAHADSILALGDLAPKFPEGPTIEREEIIKLAKYLNDFVSNDTK